MTSSWWARAARDRRFDAACQGGLPRAWRWGLLDQVTATGCPPIHTYCFDFGPFTISGRPGTDDTPVAYGPRRTALDKLLVDAASEAGAEVRESFTVSDLVADEVA
jgi:flavin-dependent dehydrogenase